MPIATIPKTLEKKRIFTFTQAVSQGLSRYAIAKLLKDGHLERVNRGLYQVTATSFSNEDIYRQATTIVGVPSAVCLWSALVFYDLTDEIDAQTWVWVPLAKRVRNKNVRVVRAKELHWRTGIVHNDGYWITSIERTVVEALAYPRFVGTMAANNALKKALNKKHTDIGKIVEMATKLGLLQRIRKILEVYF